RPYNKTMSLPRAYLATKGLGAEPGADRRRLRSRRPSGFQSLCMNWSCQGLAATPGEPPPVTVAPFNCHSTSAPVVGLYQRMSLKPSPWKSPVCAMIQGLATEPGEPPPLTLMLLMNQIRTWPVLLFCQRMSLLPSPLKSPVPTIAHGLTAEPGEPPPRTVA